MDDLLELHKALNAASQGMQMNQAKGIQSANRAAELRSRPFAGVGLAGVGISMSERADTGATGSTQGATGDAG